MSRAMIIVNQSKYVEIRSNTSQLLWDEVAYTITVMATVFMGKLPCLNIIWDKHLPEDIVYR
ncbi:hypothetical protein CRI64_00335 [Escherichia sp. E2748]|nr:hypothetical protein CRI64_00335 [Escherichia sp. E2748]